MSSKSRRKILTNHVSSEFRRKWPTEFRRLIFFWIWSEICQYSVTNVRRHWCPSEPPSEFGVFSCSVRIFTGGSLMLFRRLEGHKVSPYSNNEPTLFLNYPLIVATPKQIRDIMKVDGLTNDEVKSHLQVEKYRMYIRKHTLHPTKNFSASDQPRETQNLISLSRSDSPQGPLDW
ncbi:hypothetical protein YC2023_083617 [Brassica napus]